MQKDIHLTCVRRMDMYMLCITGSVAWFWGDIYVCAPQVCLEGNCFTVCGGLHAILCAVKRQASVVHRRVYILSLEGSPVAEDGTPVGSLEGRTSKDGRSLLEDGSSAGGQCPWKAGLCWRIQ